MEPDLDFLLPGPAFPFVKALAAVNRKLNELDTNSEELFHVVMIDCNAYDDLLVTETIERYANLLGRLTCMLGKNTNIDQKAILYLSDDEDNVIQALGQGIAAATMSLQDDLNNTPLRLAFDGDGVIFSDASERIYKEQGFDAFLRHEEENENNPMEHGPFKEFLKTLVKLQNKFRAEDKCPIRTYLVTSRGTRSQGIRALKTLLSWDLEIDEAFFRSGAPKGPVLKAIGPHLFFDDQKGHVAGAAYDGIVACHVPYGIANAND